MPVRVHEIVPVPVCEHEIVPVPVREHEIVPVSVCEIVPVLILFLFQINDILLLGPLIQKEEEGYLCLCKSQGHTPVHMYTHTCTHVHVHAHAHTDNVYVCMYINYHYPDKHLNFRFAANKFLFCKINSIYMLNIFYRKSHGRNHNCITSHVVNNFFLEMM